MALSTKQRYYVNKQIEKYANNLFDIFKLYIKSDEVLKNITLSAWNKILSNKFRKQYSRKYKERIVTNFYLQNEDKISKILKLSNIPKTAIYHDEDVKSHILNRLYDLFISGIIYNYKTQNVEKCSYPDDIKNILIKEVEELQNTQSILNKINKANNKQYTYDSLSDKISELACGYIYQQFYSIINEFITQEQQLINTSQSIGPVFKAFREVIKNYAQNFKITEEFCNNHFNCTYEDLNKLFHFANKQYIINSKDYEELISDSFHELSIAIHNMNNSDIYKYLAELDNDDKIDQYYGEISYDPHNLLIRSGPIVVYRDFSINPPKDIVLIGAAGEHHSTCIKKKDPEIFNKCINNNVSYMDECYFYKPYCCYIEQDRVSGYSADEVVKILKADPRIERVYLSPGKQGGKLKRLAHCFK